MIFPASHDRGTVERIPWVTIAIALLMVGSFLVSRARWDAVERSAELRGAAISYWLDYPTAEPPPELLPPATVEALRGELGVEKGLTSPVIQERLEALSREWLESTEDNVLYANGVVPDEVGPRGLVLHPFFHGGWGHLLGNLLVLYLTAPFVEDRWGRWRFLAFFVLASVVSGTVFANRFPDLHSPLIGASGAINGVVGAFLVEYFRARLQFVVAPFFPLPPYWSFSVPALVVLPAVFALDLLMSVAGDRLVPGMGLEVAYWAHVGGFVFGLGVAAVAKGVSRRMPAARGIEAALADAERARKLVGRGRSHEAWSRLRQILDDPPADVELLRHCWQTACLAGVAREAAPGIERGLRRVLVGEGTGDVASLWRTLVSDVPLHGFDPAFELRVAEILLRRGEEADASLALRRIGEQAEGGLPPGLSRRCAALAARGDLPDAIRRDLASLAGGAAGAASPARA